MMDDYDEERFISGIYNYCDRWCERCPFIDRCYLYHMEQAQVEAHLRRGEDPDDPHVVMGDVGENIKGALEMLQRMAEEAGIDLEGPEVAEREREDYHESDLYQRVERWSMRVGVLLNRIREEMPEIGQALIRRHEEGEIKDPEQAVEALTEVRDGYELLCRYRFFVAVKTARAVSSWGEALAETDVDFGRHAREDALGTAKLIHECLGKAIQSLWRMGEFHQPWMEMTMSLAMEAEAVRQVFDARFPEHQAFRRPGLDDGV